MADRDVNFKEMRTSDKYLGTDVGGLIVKIGRVDDFFVLKCFVRIIFSLLLFRNEMCLFWNEKYIN